MTNQEAIETIKANYPPENYSMLREALDMAIAMLKEQEPVEPRIQTSSSGVTWWNVCGNCQTAINPNDKYCHECGKPVKWE